MDCGIGTPHAERRHNKKISLTGPSYEISPKPMSRSRKIPENELVPLLGNGGPTEQGILGEKTGKLFPGTGEVIRLRVTPPPHKS